MRQGQRAAALLWLAACCAGAGAAASRDDALSLRGALNAVDRRQRDLSLADYEYPDLAAFDAKPDDLAFLNVAANYNPGEFADKENFIGDYLQRDRFGDKAGYSKRISSSFRERVEEDRQRQRDEFAKTLMTNLESNGSPDGAFDEDYIQDLWERYYGNDIDRYRNSKRYYYPVFGSEAVGSRKRASYAGDLPRGYRRFLQEEELAPLDYAHMRNVHRRRNGELALPYYSYYDESKVLPISKRSSNYISRPSEKTKTEEKKATDPKVENDLSNIFGPQLKALNAKAASERTTAAPRRTPTTRKNKDPKNEITKEVFSPVASVIEKPLPIKKKSIDWSDYFGLDRRKKPDSGLDKEWLLERYHKAIAVSAKKRNAEVAPQPSRGESSGKNKGVEGVDGKPTSDVTKHQDLAEKLETMEENVLQDVIKYTGAHQDHVDSQEIQDVKDKIISRLAAAYNLEKMKIALEEYKKSQSQAKLQDDYTYEEKRTAIPRKQAVDDGRTGKENAKSENGIKCTGPGEDCYEQNYRTPSEIIDNHLATGQCGPIQDACKQVSMLVGQYGPVFETACAVHQMCYLCNTDSWFSPTRQCNALFVSKAADLCKAYGEGEGEGECRRESAKFLRYLPEVARILLQAQPLQSPDCDVMCPLTDTWSPASSSK